MRTIIASFIVIPYLVFAGIWDLTSAPFGGSFARGNAVLSGSVERLSAVYGTTYYTNFAYLGMSDSLFFSQFKNYTKLICAKEMIGYALDSGRYIVANENVNPTNKVTLTRTGLLTNIGAKATWFDVTSQFELFGQSNGWMFCQAALSNMCMTWVPNRWGIGEGESYADLFWSDWLSSGSTSFPCVIEPYQTPIYVETNDDASVVIPSTNEWTIGDYGYAEPWNSTPFVWQWIDAVYESPEELCRTGIAPRGKFVAETHKYRYDYIEYENTDYDHTYHENGTNWEVSAISTNGATFSWGQGYGEYEAPVCFDSYPIAPRSCSSWILSNGITVLNFTNYLIASDTTATGNLVTIDLPAIPDPWGIATTNENGIMFSGGGQHFDPSIRWFAYISHVDRGTNVTFPNYASSMTIKRWHFNWP